MSLSSNNPLDYQAISDAFHAEHQRDGFTILPPSSLLHSSVPMSFVMSAGLIQVENKLDEILVKTGGKFVFTQPCFRYFDMPQVSTDSTHLSLFHMAAAFHVNCSQRETILPRLWHFLTHTLGLEPKRLWVTYLDDPEFGRDDESYQCWRSLGVPESRLLGLDKQHCFWRQRSLGQIASDGKKCGPHTEIFYERPDHEHDCKTHCQSPPNCNCGRFVEISNSLFIENNIDDAEKLHPAGTVFSECVIGLERIAMILQQQKNVYHIQRFQSERDALRSFLPNQLTVSEKNSINLCLDHFSAFVKLTQDGAPAPGKGGRARIMRKLARGMMSHLLLHDLPVDKILLKLAISTEQQPSLQRLQEEYQRFQQTVINGKRELEQLLNRKPSIDLNTIEYKILGLSKLLLKKYYHEIMKNRTLNIEVFTNNNNYPS
ncbi:MAG: alanine--tRNA ligase-related protein [Pseudomonadota bacterium]